MLRRALLTLVFITFASANDLRRLATAIDSIGITVSDLDRSVEFYTGVLGFEKLSESEMAGDAVEHLYGVFGARIRTARLRLGEEYIELTEYLAPEGRVVTPGSRSNDRWFQHAAIIVSDMDRAYKWLRQHKVRHASAGPQRLPDWNTNAGGIQAFYFRDPDGHALEILHFPDGKGDPKWHRPSVGRLFLGIDHTAIVVSDTDASLRFYRDLLGLHVVGQSENYGPEQERLNNVFGARLRITALRAETGPGVEFLEYLSPLDGRPYPDDARPNDLIHWHTKVLGTNAEQAVRTLRDQRTRFISSGAMEVPDADPEYRKSLLVRDPDGHAVLIAGR